jgi:hypothetical protein
LLVYPNQLNLNLEKNKKKKSKFIIKINLQKSSIKSGASRIRSGVELIYRSFDVIVKASICRARSLGS